MFLSKWDKELLSASQILVKPRSFVKKRVEDIDGFSCDWPGSNSSLPVKLTGCLNQVIIIICVHSASFVSK